MKKISRTAYRRTVRAQERRAAELVKMDEDLQRAHEFSDKKKQQYDKDLM